MNLPLRKHRGVDRMPIEHKASLSLEPERVAQGRCSCFSMAVTVLIVVGRGVKGLVYSKLNCAV